MDYQPTQPRLHQKLLVGTSQGSKTDLPPPQWIREELERFGAINTESKWFADLEGTVHPLYHKERWANVEVERHAALRQSFLLSTKLLEVAGVFLCNFLPPDHFDLYLDEESGRLPITEENYAHMIARAMAELEAISKDMQWDEDPDMWADKHHVGGRMAGLTHLRLEDPGLGSEYGIEQPEQWYDEDERAKEAGEKYRRMTITIASQYIDAILNSAEGSAERLTAVFMAAITMTHEIAHFIFFSYIDRRIEYFWAGNDIRAEIGFSFIAWLFDGWFPEVNHLGNDADYYAFKCGLHWSKMWRQPIKHPRAEIFYSIPLIHIQRILSQQEWSNFQDLRSDSLAVRHRLLRPKIPFAIGKHARRGRLLHKNCWNWDREYEGFQELSEDDSEDEDSYPERAHVDEDWNDKYESASIPKGGSHKGGNDKGGNGNGGSGNGGNGSNGSKPPTGGKRPSESPTAGKKRKWWNDGNGDGGKHPKKKQTGLPRSEKLLKKEGLLAQLDIELNVEHQNQIQALTPFPPWVTDGRNEQLDERQEMIIVAHRRLSSLSILVTKQADQAAALANSAGEPASFSYGLSTALQENLLDLSTLFTEAAAQVTAAELFQTPSWTPDERYDNADARFKAEARIRRGFNGL
ncbi:MAG: hypothetical protein Q9187_003291, partial [Circinaria calcarea]